MEISRNSVISPPPKFENFINNNLNIFKSIFKNSLKMNFGRNFAKFRDFGHVRIFLTNEIQNPGYGFACEEVEPVKPQNPASPALAPPFLQEAGALPHRTSVHSENEKSSRLDITTKKETNYSNY